MIRKPTFDDIADSSAQELWNALSGDPALAVILSSRPRMACEIADLDFCVPAEAWSGAHASGQALRETSRRYIVLDASGEPGNATYSIHWNAIAVEVTDDGSGSVTYQWCGIQEYYGIVENGWRPCNPLDPFVVAFWEMPEATG